MLQRRTSHFPFDNCRREVTQSTLDCKHDIFPRSPVALELHQEALARVIRPKDLDTAHLIDTSANRAFLSQAAYEAAQSDFSTLAMRPFPLREKFAYSVISTPHAIVLNQLNHVIRDAKGVKTSDRDTIIRRLITILSEGVPHRLYKFDIKEFYDSVDTRSLADAILVDPEIPRATLLVLGKYLDKLHQGSIRGLPRGIPLSATLAEYALKDFDAAIATFHDVYFYARYVDDIVLVTSAREDSRAFERRVRRALPFNLDFNSAKTRVLDIPVTRSNGRATVGNLDYLGYNIAVHESARFQGRLARTVDVSIAKKKLTRIKTRICHSVIDFIEAPNIRLLTRRLQLLTGNYNVREYATGQLRNVGLYCNYRHANKLEGLLELDSFLRAMLIGNRTRLASRFAASASRTQRRSLLRFSFARGFSARTFYNFDSRELATLKECWRDA